MRRQVEELRPKAEALEELRKELALMQQQVGRAIICAGCYHGGRCRKQHMLMQQQVGGGRGVLAVTRVGCWR